MGSEPATRLVYFSDVLCIWAYLAQIKVDEVRAAFGSRIEIESRFISVFGDTAAKIGAGWKDRGGFAGYARHVAEIAARFPHAPVHPEVWTRDAPASSMGCHLLLEAVRVMCDEGELPALRPAAAAGAPRGRPLVEELAWRLRSAFFAEARNVGERAVQHEIAEALGLPLAAIDARIANGSAFAALSSDAELQRVHAVQGSPTWLLNEGRQKLYGNVGYRVIEANLREALAAGTRELASWC